MKRIYLLSVKHDGETHRRTYEDKKMAKAHRDLMKNAESVSLEEVMLVGRSDIPIIPIDLVTNIATADNETDSAEKPTSPFPWTSHGHLIPGCDMRGWEKYKPSQVARCGGPRLCGRCGSEALKIKDGQKK